MSERIDSIISESAFKEVEKLQTQLHSLQDEFVATIGKVINLNADIGKSTSFKDMNKNSQDAAIALQKLQQQQIKTEKAQLSLDAANARATTTAQKHSQTITEQSRVYVQLDNELKKATKDAQDLGILHGKNSEIFKKSASSVKELRDKFVDIDAALGLHNRTVGDYRNQIVNALQDMLPFGSQLGRITNSIEDFSPALAAGVEGLGTFAVATIGAGVAVAALIAVPLVAYFKGTQDGENALKLVTNELEIGWNHAREAAEDFGNSIAYVFSDKHTSEGVNYWIEIKNAMLEFFNIASVGATKKIQFFSDETIAKGKEITDLQIQIQKNQSVLALNIAKSNDEFQIQRDIARDITLTENKHGKELEEGEKKRQVAVAAAVAASEKIKSLKTDELKDQIKLLQLQQSEDKNDANKLVNIKKINDIQAEIYQADADAKKEQSRIVQTGRALDVADLKRIEAEQKKADEDEKKRLKEAADAEKKKTEAQQKYFDQSIKDAKAILDNRIKLADAEVKDKKDTTDRINAINQENQREQEAARNAFIKHFEETEKTKADLIKKGDAMAIEIDKQDTDRRNKKFESIIEHEKQLFDVATAFLSAKFDLEKNTLALKDKQQQESFDKEAELINKSLLSDQQKADKLAILDSQRLQQKAANDRAERDIEIRKAKFDKESALFQIAITTALNIIKLWLIPPLAIAAGIEGAAQAAVVLAQPIPKFEKGGKMKETGLAEYGHGQELRIDPGGKLSLTGSTPEIGLVKKGTQFISNRDLVQMIAKPDKIAYAGGDQIDIQALIEATNKSSRRIEDAIISTSKRPERGINYYSTRKGSNYLRRNI